MVRMKPLAAAVVTMTMTDEKELKTSSERIE
jgi:hypothetical protein